MPSYYSSRDGHKLRGKRRAPPSRVVRMPKVPEVRVPLDKCPVPLWRILSTRPEVVKFTYKIGGKPVYQAVNGKLRQCGVEPEGKGGGRFVRYFVTLEYFKGDTVQFVVYPSKVYRLGTPCTRHTGAITIDKVKVVCDYMSQSEFEAYVMERTGQKVELP
jgi:hypothetical protein